MVCLQAAAAAPQTVTGRVLFPDGTVLGGATVQLTREGATPQTVTADARGVFSFLPVEPGSYELSVQYDGVAAGRRSIEVEGEGEIYADITVELAGLRETVTVTATLESAEAGAIPSSVVVLEGERLRNAAGVMLDEALRMVPGFSLFRRTSSFSAHPTSQGVSLRGIGPSGASRSLVLVDGFPVNDPFGGWVYWNRIPREALASAEILRGAASSLYGNAALSGIASILSERPQRAFVRASISGGGTGLVDGSWFLSTRTSDDRWGFSLDGESLRNDGYFAIRTAQRGSVDRPISLAYTTARGRIERQFGNVGAVYLSGGILTEDRVNGTTILENSTDLRYGSIGAEWQQGANHWRMGAFAQGETFRSTFSSITNNRNRETLTLNQRVPSNAVTARGEWARPIAHHRLAAGGDVRWVEGDSIEASPFGTAIHGGRQWVGGVFLQDVFAVFRRIQVVVSLRMDHWNSRDGATGRISDATVFNPQLGFRYRIVKGFSIRAQGYRGFRGPTLNELYRQFQVGNVITLANPSLRPERTDGGEAGFDVERGPYTFRVTGFWTELRNPVSNVTVSAGPPQIIRVRQNVGRARVRGAEADWLWRPRPDVEFRLSYLFDDARVARFDPDPRLQGRLLPQVPRHQGTIGLGFGTWGGGMLRLETRLSDIQFDDDRNTIPLSGFAEVGAAFVLPVGQHMEWFVRAQNLFDRRYPVARTPIETLSAPRIAQVGVRFKWNGH